MDQSFGHLVFWVHRNYSWELNGKMRLILQIEPVARNLNFIKIESILIARLKTVCHLRRPYQEVAQEQDVAVGVFPLQALQHR